MTERPSLDVSDLPTVVLGSRAAIWWGTVGFMAIEGTMFAILVAAYFYLRGEAIEWPPSGVRHPGLGITTLNLVLLLATLLPMNAVSRAATRADLGSVWRWTFVSTLLMMAFMAVRVMIFQGLTFRWDSHAYGSLIWTATGLHTVHVLTDVSENIYFLILLKVGPVQDKHLPDLRLNVFYWRFVVACWVVFYAIFYLDPGLLRLR